MTPLAIPTLGLLLAVSPQPAAPKDKETDEKAIRGLVERMSEAWAKGDGRAFAAVFAADADYVVFDGTRLQGRKAIGEAHQRLFDTVLKGTRLGGRVTSVRFLTPDAAVVHGEGGVLRPGEAEVSARQRSVQTLVAVRRGGGWAIEAFHNTRAQPPGPPR
jgi:uncharacterized protein (TIGR02246 family)